MRLYLKGHSHNKITMYVATSFYTILLLLQTTFNFAIFRNSKDVTIMTVHYKRSRIVTLNFIEFEITDEAF